MKRIEVKLSLPVVAPLLDVIKGVAAELDAHLTAPGAPGDVDAELQHAWTEELLTEQNGDVRRLLGLFGEEFFAEGVIALDEENAQPVLRACAALRLRLRANLLAGLGDEPLESGNIDPGELAEPVRRGFLCYLFLATIQELIIQHLDASILGS